MYFELTFQNTHTQKKVENPQLQILIWIFLPLYLALVNEAKFPSIMFSLISPVKTYFLFVFSFLKKVHKCEESLKPFQHQDGIFKTDP